MTQFAAQHPQALVGQSVVDEHGEEIGRIAGIYLDEGTQQPEWAAVDLGRSGFTVVPLAGATVFGGGVEVAVERQVVAAAPYRHSRLPRSVSEEEEAELYRHYQVGPGARRPPSRPTRSSRPPAAAAASDVGAAATQESRQVARTAADEGRQVATAAAEEGREVATAAAEEGRQVATAAAERAKDAAGTAREQAAQVGQEVSAQARTLLDETTAQLEGQVRAQAERAAEALRSLAGEVRAVAEGRPGEGDRVVDYLGQAAERLRDVADDVEAKGPQGLLDDVQRLARTRPTTFLLGTAVAGFVVGRVARSGR